MNRPSLKRLTILLPLCASALMGALALTACQPPGPTDPTVDPAPGPSESRASALPVQGKPSAPVAVEYKVLGTPAVGQPTEIELSFANGQGDAPVSVSYRIADSASLSFVDSLPDKVPVQMQRANGGRRGLHRVWIKPLSEGRHLLNVVTEIETDTGKLSKSTSIAIDVAGPGVQQQNKQVQQTPATKPQVDSAGEAIISMPAQQSAPTPEGSN